ncbi:Fructose-2,6-bisphosphatase [Malassezia yamatoensis]|uniref:fructose-2,6-bisphosphate 2-phosphatase n=1 Tax=Malassezia yamatoensis TaxID=253288 RepID=A0AAJ6CJF6_9BASI|nr:Fructose-2,6-bisphosphatase [Malassezia yamatoensis]
MESSDQFSPDPAEPVILSKEPKNHSEESQEDTTSPDDDSRGLATRLPPLAMSREASGESTLSRPAFAPDPAMRRNFEERVAETPLGSTSDGLLALLRDHPELVSNELAKEAGKILPNKGILPVYQSNGNYDSSPNEAQNVESTLFPGEAQTKPIKEKSMQPGHTNPFPDGARPKLQSSNSARRIKMRKASLSNVPPATPNLGQTVAAPDYGEEKIVVAMVGLPARGKSYLSNKLMRYLRWREYKVKVFNVGQMRRAKARMRQEKTGVKEDQTAAFFDSHNAAGQKQRNELASECLEQLITWLRDREGNVGIHDATNTTKERRKQIAQRVAQEPGLRLVFLESLCTDQAVIAENIEVKISSADPDYSHLDREKSKEDFLRRIKHYADVYEPLDADGTESMYSYCKIVDVGRSATMNLISGYLESQIAFYLMNLHVTPRNIFFSRHGESQFNVEGKIGGDADLSERGWAYAKALPKLIKEHIGDAPLTVWHSSLRRTGQTASMLDYPKLVWNSLDELDAGVCDSMTYEEIEKYYPEDYASRDEDKFNYRYRGGESYRDVLVRLEPVIMELERQDNILIIGHQAIIRALYAYFHGYDQNELPYIKVPLHTVIQLTPKAYGCDEKRYALPIQAVDTHRERPQKSLASSTSSLRLGSEDSEDELLRASTSLPPSQRTTHGA